MVQLWEVVGGGDKGGLIVREELDTKSDAFDERLETGSIVEEFDLKSGRMYFRLVNGRGPARGWVSTKIRDRPLLTKTDSRASKVVDTEDIDAVLRARCERELKRPALQWTRITNETVSQGHDKVAKGMTYGMEFPWSEETLEKMGPEWMTAAFHAVGSMPRDNKVNKIILKNKTKITTGNNGGKFLFEVEYEKTDPNLHTKLFAKVPHPFEGATKFDRINSSVTKQPSELYEINAYRLLESTLPMKTPRFYFGDISNETSNWIIITERIDFHDFDGNNFGPPAPTRPPPLPAYQIEGPYDKCIDYNLRGDAKEYYMLLTKVGAEMAGLSKCGKMGSLQLQQESFGHGPDPKKKEMWGMKTFSASGEDPKQVDAKLNNALKFWQDIGKAIFPQFVQTDKWAKKFKHFMLKLNAYTQELNYWMHENEDYMGLGHVNLNVDNAYFWRDDQGKLECGVFDWGGLGVGTCGVKLWWWYYCMDYVDFKAHIRQLLDCYVESYKEYCGLQLDKAVFDSVAGFWSSHYAYNTAHPGKSSLYFVVRCRAKTTEITIQESEIAEAKWFTLEEKRKLPYPQKGSAVDVLDSIALSGADALEAKRLQIRMGAVWTYTAAPRASL